MRYLHRNGHINMLKRILFIVGICLLAFSIFFPLYTKQKQEKMIKEQRQEILGVLEIPKIDVCLPVYPGVSEEELKHGVGHIPESKWIDAGTDLHCLIAGHRGLPGATLLTRLHEMQIGDCFYVKQGDQTYQYEVCQIRTISPENTKTLIQKVKGEFVSLITCTPYGVNTHRLIVTGKRMEE